MTNYIEIPERHIGTINAAKDHLSGKGYKDPQVNALIGDDGNTIIDVWALGPDCGAIFSASCHGSDMDDAMVGVQYVAAGFSSYADVREESMAFVAKNITKKGQAQ